jgi:hypothetical protein
MPTRPTVTRRHTRLSTDNFDLELQHRAVTQRQFAQIAGLHEVTLSRARQGQPITEATFRKIASALLRIPSIDGAHLLVGPQPNEAGTALPVETQTLRARDFILDTLIREAA